MTSETLQDITLSSHAFSVLVQLILAVLASTFAVKLLTLRQDRRKIAGDASAQEANAASVLSGAALQMVEQAQKTARDAEVRAQKADERAQHTEEEAERRVAEGKVENQRLWGELQRARWEIHWLQIRERLLEMALESANIEIPPIPESMLASFPDYDAPPPPLPPAHSDPGKHETQVPTIGLAPPQSVDGTGDN